MLDRTIQPKINPIESIHFPWPKLYMLKNNLPCYVLNMGVQPIVELELFFRSGKYYETCAGASAFVASMLLEGTSTKTNQEIAYLLDYYGAVVTTHAQEDFCSIVLSTLSKHLEPMLALLEELILDSNFPVKSFERLKALKMQSIQMADKKNKYVAHKKFCEALFSKKHPYGRFLTLEELSCLKLEDVCAYYKQNFFAEPTAFVSGNFSLDAWRRIEQFLEQLPKQKALPINHVESFEKANKIHMPGEKQVQSAIVIGKKLLMRKDQDFLPMMIVNTLLGGYFGSRLMQNIREDKGYTYGIASRMVSLQQAGYFMITAQVAFELTEKTIQEVCKEIQLLQQDLVPDKELEKVRNYLLGSFLNTINDPFSIMQKFQIVNLCGLDQRYYTAFYHHIKNITPIDIRNLAQKYLSLSTLTEIVKF